MKVLALIRSADHVCYRYRLEAFAWSLARRGLFLETAPLQRGATRLAQLWATRRADVVLLQRRLLRLHEWLILRRRARRLIYDVDDALFIRDSYHPKGLRSDWRLFHFWNTVRGCDAVLAGNPFLAEYVSRFADPAGVMLMPTCVEPERYRPTVHRRRGAAARLVWIGQASTMPSLELIADHLGGAAADLPGLELSVICDRLPRVPGLRVTLHPWSEQTEASDLAACDIGINWLPDDTWSRGKCGLKVLQYMAAGLPVIGNPVGMNREMIVHGETGFLASTPAEWASAIRRLANDPTLRQRMGTAGRRMIERQYRAGDWGPRLAHFIRQVALAPQWTGSSPRPAPTSNPPSPPSRRASLPTVHPETAAEPSCHGCR